MTTRAKRNQIDRTSRFSRARLDPPRQIAFAAGTLSWVEPADTSGVTHYRIYEDNEFNLVREVPVGQHVIEDNIVADRVFMSSWNEPLQRESCKVLLQGPISGAILSGLYKGTY